MSCAPQPDAPLAVLAPLRPLVSGAAQFNSAMVKALRDDGPVAAIGWKRLYPPVIHTRATHEADATTPADDGAPMLDYVNPTSWRRALQTAVDAGARAVVLPWLHPVMAPPYRYLLRASTGRMLRVVVCHNVLPHGDFRGARLLTRATLRHADLIVTHAPQQRDELRELGLGTQPVLELFHPRFLVDDLAPPASANAIRAERARHGNPDVLLLAFGAVRPYKGVDLAIRSLAQLERSRRVRLVVAGCFWDGGQAELAALACELGVEHMVEFRDRFVPHDEAALLFGAADAALLPYRSASQSGVVQLSFAYGTPVLATAVGGLPAAVRDGVDGLLCQPDDPAAIARMIEEFTQRRTELGAGVEAAAYAHSFARYARLLRAAVADAAGARVRSDAAPAPALVASA